jgi:hypothetical protein
MSRPLVTIISPTYNQSSYVAACAASALAQTYEDWEQIFVDDGSTDSTREILATFDDPRIRVVPLPHGGLGELARSYNTALAVGRGSLVAILEGDDQWPADKLEQQVPAFDDADTILSWGRADLIDDDGSVVGKLAAVRTRASLVRIPASQAFRRLTRVNFLAPSVSVMIRRSVLDRLGGFRQTGSSMLVDLPTWLWATATESGHVAFVNARLGLYRVHGAQTSQQRRSQMTREHIAIVRAIGRELSAEQQARIGWGEQARQHAECRASLAEGETLLATGRWGAARREFLDALRSARETRSAADAALAAAGLLSSALRVNLVRAALESRARLRGTGIVRELPTSSDQRRRSARTSP